MADRHIEDLWNNANPLGSAVAEEVAPRPARDEFDDLDYTWRPKH